MSHIVIIGLFRKMLDEMTWRKASKYGSFHEAQKITFSITSFMSFSPILDKS